MNAVVTNRPTDEIGARTTNAIERNAPVLQANAAGNVLEALKPDAVFFGESHGDTPLGSFGRGGNFATISTRDGSVGYYGSQFLSAAPPIGTARGAISLIGTNNSGGQESRVGLTYRVPTPVGDMMLFVNVGQDQATASNLINALQGKSKETFTASVNLGVAYSASDGAVNLLAGAAPGAGFVLASGLTLSGVDGWVGLGWSGKATFKNGELQSVNISGVEVKAADIAKVLGQQVQQARNSPPLIPNGGNTAIASLNDDIQLAFGQSPWDVGFSALVKEKNGAVSVKNGEVDFRNHGNPVTAVTQPVYQLGVKFGVLAPGQRIANNAQAGQVVDAVLDKALQADKVDEARGVKSTRYIEALNSFMNPYQLDHGSKQLKTAYDFYNTSTADQQLTNSSRVLQGLKPLPSVVFGIQKPADYQQVRGVFAGDLRWKPDLGEKHPTNTGFGRPFSRPD